MAQDRIEKLIRFIGKDFLLRLRDRATINQNREVLEVTGQILGGHFTLTIIFDSGERH